MITQETAGTIWNIYREINSAEKLLRDLEEARPRWASDGDKYAPRIKDGRPFGGLRRIQLGIPSGENSHRLFDVSPVLAESMIRAHIARKRAELVEANEAARAELNRPEAKADEPEA